MAKVYKGPAVAPVAPSEQGPAAKVLRAANLKANATMVTKSPGPMKSLGVPQDIYNSDTVSVFGNDPDNDGD